MRDKSRYNKETFSNIVIESRSVKEVCEKLGISHKGNSFRTVKKYINLYELDTSHFKTREEILADARNKRELKYEDIFCENSKVSSTTLRNKVIKNNLLKYECSICNLTEWNGVEITLQLDHINGVSNDNRLNNLRFLCPNCHSQTETWGFKNKGEKQNPDLWLCECGKNKDIKSKMCIDCFRIKNRKVKNRPDIKTLLEDVSKLGYVKTGKKYGVSDNAIRKWIK